METQYLQYFVSVAKHLNFNRAAEECHVSQPALSAQIKKFEGILGCQLFYRSKRHVQLTPEGEQLLVKARKVLCEMNSIKDLAVQLKDPLKGTIRIGFSSLICLCRAFSTIKKLQKNHPDMRLEFEEDSSEKLLERMMLGEFDLILIQYLDKLKSPSFQFKVFEKNRLMQIVSKEGLTHSDAPFVITRESCPLRPLMVEAAKANGMPTRHLFPVNDLNVIKRVVEIGAGWSVIPENSLNKEDRKFFKVTPLDVHVEHAMVVNQGFRSQSLLEAFYNHSQNR